MRIEKILIVFILVIFAARGAAYGQYYSTAVGARLGNASGLTGKISMGKRSYLEGLFTARWSGFNITALAEITQPMPDTPGLGWYYGFGANLGFWDDPGDSVKETDLFVGADFILGMEYTFEDVPINASIDWKPYFNVLTNPGFEFDEFALSVRYVIRGR